MVSIKKHVVITTDDYRESARIRGLIGAAHQILTVDDINSTVTGLKLVDKPTRYGTRSTLSFRLERGR